MKFVLLIGLIFLVFTPLLKAVGETCETAAATTGNNGFYDSPSHANCVLASAGCATGFSFTKGSTTSPPLTADCNFCSAVSDNNVNAQPGDPLMTYSCVTDGDCDHRFTQANNGDDCLTCATGFSGTNCATCSADNFDRPYQLAASACAASCAAGYGPSSQGGNDCNACLPTHTWDRLATATDKMCIERAGGSCNSGFHFDRLKTLSTSTCIATGTPCAMGYGPINDCQSCDTANDYKLNKPTAADAECIKDTEQCASGFFWNKKQTDSTRVCADVCDSMYGQKTATDNCELCAKGNRLNSLATAAGSKCVAAAATCAANYVAADDNSDCNKCATNYRVDRLATADGAQCVIKGATTCAPDHAADADDADCNKCASGKMVDRPAYLAGAKCASDCYTPYTGTTNCDACASAYVWNAPKTATAANPMCVMKSEGSCMTGYTDNGAGKDATDTSGADALKKDCSECADSTKEVDAATGECKAKAAADDTSKDTSKDTDKSTSGDSKTNSAILGFVISTMALLLAIFI